MSVLSHPRFNDEQAAYEWVEARLWPNGPICPHCGATDRIKPLKGKSTRVGVKKCYHCYKPFTVKVAPSSRTATSRCSSGCKPST